MPEVLVETTHTTSTTNQTRLRRFFHLVRLAWVVWMATILLVTVFALPYFLEGTQRRFCTPIEDALNRAAIPLTTCGAFVTILAIAAQMVAVSISALIYLRQPTRWVGLIAAYVPIATTFTAYSITHDLALAYPELALSFFVLQTLSFSFVILALFVLPDGRFVPRYSQWFIPIFWGVNFIWVAGRYVAALNPLNISVTLWGWVFLTLGIASQIYRSLRVSTPQQRQQTKLLVLGAIFSFIATTPLIALSNLAQVELQNTPDNAPLLLAYCAIVISRFGVFTIMPIAFAVSILRYRLWDIDLFVNRTLVVASVTVILAVVFLGSILLTQQLALLITQGDQSGIALAIASLGVALLFNPTRARIQAFIDRRFYPDHLVRIAALARDAYREPSTTERNILYQTELTRLQSAQSDILINHYRLLEPIGLGGMSDVYRAENINTKQQVVVKTTSKSKANTPELLLRFEREAKVIATLDHPNIIRVLEHGVHAEDHYMVLEYVPGIDLHRYLQRQRKLNLKDALPIFTEIAAALDYTHSHHLIHRDVKPSNVLLDPMPIRAGAQFRAVLTDFGIVKKLSGGTVTHTDGVVGTLDYIAPEQIVAEHTIDHRADIYAFGVVLYQALTGHLPFTAPNVGALLMAHLQSPPPDPRKFAPNLSDQTARTILRALEKEPYARPKSAGALIASLSLSDL
ncbi:MAG: hypothetical protein OHK0023_04120 [Anaerolineae bacterium]